MKMNLIKMLILDSLSIDDEPISLIIKETKIEDNFRSRLKKKYSELEISELNVIEAINELFNEDMIMIYELNNKKEIEFKNGKLNAAYNAVDRNANNWRKNKIALYWEGDSDEKKRFTFKDLSELSSQFANLLHSLNVDISDRVFFFLERMP